MFTRAPLVKQTAAPKVAAPAAQAPDYFSKEELTETLSPEYSYSLAGTRAFSSGEDDSGANRYRGLRRLPIQAKLAVGAVDDPLEREADETAERVLGMSVGRSASFSKAGPSVQRKCSCGGSCEKCKAGQPDEEVQRKPAGAGNVRQSVAPPIVHEVIRSQGRPLDLNTRSFMEPRFGQDLSSIRVHTDDRASDSARQIHARAYTVGSQIVFGKGQFSPTTTPGRRLLAHELTHVLQQTRNHPEADKAQRDTVSPSAAPKDVTQCDQKDYVAGRIAQDIEENAWVQPNPYQYIMEQFEDLGSLEDNVGAALIKIQVDSGRLIKIASSSQGRRVLDMLYDAVITGDVTEFEREQATEILKAKGKTRAAPDRATLKRMRDPMVFPIADQHYFSDCYATIQAKLLPSGRVEVYYDTVRVFRCEEYNKAMATIFRHHSREEILNGFELDADELIGVKLFDEDDEPLMYVPAIMLIDYSNQQKESTLGKIKTVAILGATMGLGAVGGAGVWGTIDSIAYALTAASAAINDYAHEIKKTAGGRAFMSVWKYVDAAVEYYGWGRMGVEGVQLVKSRVGPALKEWRAEGPSGEASSVERDAIEKAQNKAAEWMQAADQMEVKEAEKYMHDHPPKNISDDPPGKRHADVGPDHQVFEVETPGGISCELHSGIVKVDCPEGLGGGKKDSQEPPKQAKATDQPRQEAKAADVKKTSKPAETKSPPPDKAPKSKTKKAKRTDAVREHPNLPSSVANPKNYTAEEVAGFYRRNRGLYPKEIQSLVDEIPLKKPTRASLKRVDKAIRDLHTNEANRLAGFENKSPKPFEMSVKGASNEGGQFSSLATDQKQLTLVGRLKNGGKVEFDSVQFNQSRIVETKINLDRSTQAEVMDQMARQSTFARDWGFSEVQWEVWDYVGYRKAQIALRKLAERDAELAIKIKVVDPSQSH